MNIMTGLKGVEAMAYPVSTLPMHAIVYDTNKTKQFVSRPINFVGSYYINSVIVTLKLLVMLTN